MIPGAFVLKIKTPSWCLCVVKQAPDQSESSWMLFGKNKSNKATFQMEFKPHQETQLINHLINMTDDEELRLVLVAESPAISCIESLWSLKGLEMYRNKPSSLSNSLHQCIHMLSTSPQISNPSNPSNPSNHSMQTRSKASRR